MMNDFNSDVTKRLLDRFNASDILASAANNIFKIAEHERAERFKQYSVAIPWYLRPFKSAITAIAYKSFKDGLGHDNKDTVTFRRPAEYKGVE